MDGKTPYDLDDNIAYRHEQGFYLLLKIDPRFD